MPILATLSCWRTNARTRDQNQSFRRRRDKNMKQVKSEGARLDRLEKAILAEMVDNIDGN